jgi:hypothetical protein
MLSLSVQSKSKNAADVFVAISVLFLENDYFVSSKIIRDGQEASLIHCITHFFDFLSVDRKSDEARS